MFEQAHTEIQNSSVYPLYATIKHLTVCGIEVCLFGPAAECANARLHTWPGWWSSIRPAGVDLQRTSEEVAGGKALQSRPGAWHAA